MKEVGVEEKEEEDYKTQYLQTRKQCWGVQGFRDK